MRRTCTILLTFLFFALLFPVNVSADEEKDLTVMVYMCGSNLESDTGAASRDLKEIMRSGYDSENVNVIAMTGGTSKWWSSFDATETAIYDLAGRRPEKVYANGLLDMGDSQTLTRFLDYADSNYPAKNYALVLWDHGGGPLGGVCLDYASNGDILDMQELKTALSQSFAAKQKLEWIGFDACLMASVETAYLLKDYAGYMIASEETEPGEGWNYDFLETIDQDKNAEETAGRIIDDYFSDSGEQDVTMSCIDLSKMDQVKEKMDSFFQEIASTLNTDTFPALSEAIQKVHSYGRVGTDSQSYDLMDLYDLISQYQLRDQKDAKALLDTLDESIVCNRSTGEGSYGLSVYHPYYNKQQYQSSWKELYPTLSLCDGYTRYLKRFSSIWLGDPITDWADLTDKDITVDSSGDQESTVEVPLSQEQTDQYVSGQVIVLEENEDGYHQVSSSDDVTISQDGNVIANVSPQKLYVVDEDGNTLAGPVTYDLQEGKYQIVACCLDTETQQMISVRMICVPQEDDPTRLQTESTFVYDSLLENFTNRLDINWLDYDCILFPECYKEETYDTVLKAYQDWELTDFSLEQSIFSASDWHFELREENVENDLYVTVQITDSQVNTVSSDPVPLE